MENDRILFGTPGCPPGRGQHSLTQPQTQELEVEQETTLSTPALRREWDCHRHFTGDTVKARGAEGVVQDHETSRNYTLQKRLVTSEPGQDGRPNPPACDVRSEEESQPSCLLHHPTKGSLDLTEYFGTGPGRFFLLRWVEKYFQHPTESSESEEDERFFFHLVKQTWCLGRRHPGDGWPPRTSAWPLGRRPPSLLHPVLLKCLLGERRGGDTKSGKVF